MRRWLEYEAVGGLLLAAIGGCFPEPATSQPVAGAGGTTSSLGGTGGDTVSSGGTGGAGGAAGGPSVSFVVKSAVGVGLADDQTGAGVAVDEAGIAYWAVVYEGSLVLPDGQTLAAVGGGQTPNADGLVAAIGGGGEVLWVAPLTGGDIDIKSLALGPAGTLAVGGQVFGTLDVAGTTPPAQNGNGGSDAYTALLTAGTAPGGGTVAWARRLGVDFGRRAVTSIAFDGDGSIAVAGRFQGKIDDGAGALTSSAGLPDYDVFATRLDAAGEAIGGSFPIGQGGPSTKESFARVAVDPASHEVTLLRNCKDELAAIPCQGASLTRLAGDGAEVWHAVLPLTFADIVVQQGAPLDLMFDIASAPDGGFALAGAYEGMAGDLGCGALPAPLDELSTNLVVARFDKLGACQWSRGFAGGGAKAGRSVAVGPDGRVYVTGYFNGSMNLGDGVPELLANDGKTVFVTVFDAAGRTLGARAFPGTGSASATALAALGDEVALTGWFDGTLDTGEETLTTGGERDAFLIRLSVVKVP